MAGTTLHEAPEQLSPLTRDLHRALVSVQEELEAVDWYRQRADAAADPELRQVLLHNMGEEIEHATMLLEWIRRRDPLFDQQFRAYLFTSAPLTAIETEAEGRAPASPAPANAAALTVGTMKGG